MSVREATSFRCLLAASGSGLALRFAATTPAGTLADLRSALATGSADPFAAVLPAAALLAWALVVWLSATVLLTLAGRLPGALGRCGRAAARRVAPAAVRRTVQLALGLSLVAGVTGAGAASAAPLTEGTGVVAAVPSLDWPTRARSAPASPTAAPAAALAGPTVVVAPGDTLWSLAERSLGPGATAPQVAAAWPAWWAANRDVIGPDPHVIQPGARLTPPPSSS